MDATAKSIGSPAALVANTPRRPNDGRSRFEQGDRRQLAERFGIRLTFTRKAPGNAQAESMLNPPLSLRRRAQAIFVEHSPAAESTVAGAPA